MALLLTCIVMVVAAKQRLTGLLRQRTLRGRSPPLLQSVEGNDRTWRLTPAVHANVADHMLLLVVGGPGRTTTGPEAATPAWTSRDGTRRELLH